MRAELLVGNTFGFAFLFTAKDLLTRLNLSIICRCFRRSMVWLEDAGHRLRCHRHRSLMLFSPPPIMSLSSFTSTSSRRARPESSTIPDEWSIGVRSCFTRLVRLVVPFLIILYIGPSGWPWNRGKRKHSECWPKVVYNIYKRCREVHTYNTLQAYPKFLL